MHMKRGPRSILERSLWSCHGNVHSNKMEVGLLTRLNSFNLLAHNLINSQSSHATSVLNQIVIDESPIPSGTFIASGDISIQGALMNSNQVVLGAPDSVVALPDFEVSVGSALCIFNSDCLNQ